MHGDTPMEAVHPFHLHINHFQVIRFEGGKGWPALIGQWMDTVPVPYKGHTVVRWIPHMYEGEMPYHCHIVPHSNLGMAHMLRVAPALPPSPPAPPSPPPVCGGQLFRVRSR